MRRELNLVQVRIQTAARQQLPMAPDVENAAVLELDDAVVALDGS